MYELCEKLRRLKPYDPITGSYSIRLDANESFIRLSGDVGEELMERVTQLEFNRYPDPLALGACEAFAGFYGISPQLVTAGNGSDELIGVIAGCFFEKGDTIVTFCPDFSMYAFYSSLFELNVVALDKNEELRIDVDKAIGYCNANNVKAIMFSNPCNPTSLGLTRDEVVRLIRSVNCLVILDEAYMDFWNQSLIGEVSEYDNLIILRTCSKAIGLAAVRMGFAVACEMITNALRAAKSPYNTDSLSQTIVLTVFGQAEYLRVGIERIIRSRDALYDELTKIGDEYTDIFERIYPTCTNFVYIKCSVADRVHKELLNRSIAVRSFGGALRITCGTDSENATVCKALREILGNVRKDGLI